MDTQEEIKKELGKKAKDLYKKIIRVKSFDFKNGVKLCYINGEKYTNLTWSNICYDAKIMADKLGINESSLIHTAGRYMMTLAKVSNVLDKWHIYLESVKEVRNETKNIPWWYSDEYINSLKSSLLYESDEIPRHTFSKKEMEESENSYEERVIFLNEKRCIQKNERDDVKCAKNTMDELQSLVMRIESLGWEVTLRLKKQETKM